MNIEENSNWSELYNTIGSDGDIVEVMIGVSANEPDSRGITLYQANDMQNWDSIFLTGKQIKDLRKALERFE